MAKNPLFSFRITPDMRKKLDNAVTELQVSGVETDASECGKAALLAFILADQAGRGAMLRGLRTLGLPGGQGEGADSLASGVRKALDRAQRAYPPKKAGA